MKTLVIKIKYTLDAREKVAEATVPYILNTSHNLPDVYPFNQNYYFGPDSGTFLGQIYIDEKGRFTYRFYGNARVCRGNIEGFGGE